MKDKLSRKHSSLKLAIERYNMYKSFVDSYNKTNSLNEYVSHIKSVYNEFSDEVAAHYDTMIMQYNNGNKVPLLQNLYDRLLAADGYKTKVANELNILLREAWEYNFIM